MDPNFLIGQLIPLVGTFGFFVLVALVLRWFFRSPVGEALAERIRARTRQRMGDAGVTDDRRVHALEEQVRHLQDQLTELGERVDFAERVLAEQRAQRLGAGH
ncbi:MAG: hypothetical protein ACREMV_02885 [Gemmatimonadales bacterium]